MSIYPVKLSEWFPFGDEYHDNAYSAVKFTRCLACDKRPRWKAAIGHHSIPWGYGDVWCSWKCCKSGKVAKPDKRRLRRLKRRYTDVDKFISITIPEKK